MCVHIHRVQHHQGKVARLRVGKHMPVQKICVRFQKAAHKYKAQPKAHALLRGHGLRLSVFYGHSPFPLSSSSGFGRGAARPPRLPE